MATKQQTPAQDAAQDENAVSLDQVLAATQATIENRADLVQMKMENDMMLAECRVRPRNMAEIKKSLSEMLDVFPELALQARYCKPCGTDESGKQKEARGLSVRAAEVLAEAYRYNRVRVDVTPLRDGLAKVDATFSDFENCRIWQDGGIVSQLYKVNPRYAKFPGEMRRIPDDRFWNVTCKAEASKRVREVILRSVNAALKRWFENECIKVASKLLGPDEIEKIKVYFRDEQGISLERLEKFVGREQRLGWTVDDRLRLLELKNAIEEGEVTAASAFGDDDHEGGPSRRKMRESASGRSSDADGEAVGRKESAVGAAFSLAALEKLELAEDAGMETSAKVAQVKRLQAQWMADHAKDAVAMEAIKSVADALLKKLVESE